MKYYWACFECLSKHGTTKQEAVFDEHPFNYHITGSFIQKWLDQYGNQSTLISWKEITKEEYDMHPEGE